MSCKSEVVFGQKEFPRLKNQSTTGNTGGRDEEIIILLMKKHSGQKVIDRQSNGDKNVRTTAERKNKSIHLMDKKITFQ